MRYTKIDQRTREDRDECCQPTQNISVREASRNISYFSYHFLGISPYAHQHLIFKTYMKGCKRIVICSSRQIGKSIAIAVLALWSAIFNVKPSGIHKNTKICVVSKSDEQSKKLMCEIKRLIVLGDISMKERTKQYINSNYYRPKYFSDKVDNYAPNNMTQMTFTNGCFIKCFPPTDAIRGESADILLVDEAAFVDEDIFRDAIYPTVTSTRGTIILSSTPRGQKGAFFKVFDPFDIYEEHEYTRFWFDWGICENEAVRDDIGRKQKSMQMAGDYKSFEQEYEAKFTIDCEAFFESDFIDLAVDKNLTFAYESALPCCVGVDYGMTICHTVVSIVAKEGDYFKLINQVKYPLGTSDSVVFEDLKEIYKRYPNIVKIVVDDCPQGFRTNTDLELEGFPVLKYNFRSSQADRNKGYYVFRSQINKGYVKFPPITELIVEMKGLVEEQLSINTRVGKPRGGYDDRVDSFMMACYPFLVQEDRPMKSFVTGDELIRTDMTNPVTKEDLTWRAIRDDWVKRGGDAALKKLNSNLGSYIR